MRSGDERLPRKKRKIVEEKVRSTLAKKGWKGTVLIVIRAKTRMPTDDFIDRIAEFSMKSVLNNDTNHSIVVRL